jgi:hypothetical protein
VDLFISRLLLLVLLTGEAGVGKTRMLKAQREADAADDRCAVLLARIP